MGDLGSKVLPPNHPGDVANWTVGSTPRVAWGMRFNHGGGYQYRLCPLEKMPCTEEDFQEMPLDFVRDAHAIVSMNKCRFHQICTYDSDNICPYNLVIEFNSHKELKRIGRLLIQFLRKEINIFGYIESSTNSVPLKSKPIYFLIDVEQWFTLSNQGHVC